MTVVVDGYVRIKKAVTADLHIISYISVRIDEGIISDNGVFSDVGKSTDVYIFTDMCSGRDECQ